MECVDDDDDVGGGGAGGSGLTLAVRDYMYHKAYHLCKKSKLHPMDVCVDTDASGDAGDKRLL